MMIMAGRTIKLIEIANSTLKSLTAHNGFNKTLDNLQVTEFSYDLTEMRAQVEVTQEHLNNHGSLHGGCATTLIDELTFLNHALHRGYKSWTEEHSLSVRLDVNFMSPAFEGDILQINSSLDKVGRRLTFVSAKILNKSRDDRIVAIGQQIISLDPKGPAAKPLWANEK